MMRGVVLRRPFLEPRIKVGVGQSAGPTEVAVALHLAVRFLPGLSCGRAFQHPVLDNELEHFRSRLPILWNANPLACLARLRCVCMGGDRGFGGKGRGVTFVTLCHVTRRDTTIGRRLVT